MQESLKVALIQSSLVWENPEGNRTNFSRKISAITPDTDLIILPEMFSSGFTMSPQNLDPSEGHKTVNWMKQWATEKQAGILGSLAYDEDGNYFNRLWFAQPDGTTTYYDKRHTFTLAGEDKVYKAGNKRILLHYKGFSILPQICYDLRFPVWSRNVDDYDVLVYVANWPKPRVTAWDTLLKARAIENMSYCIGVNRVGSDEYGHEYLGHSAVYNCLGEELAFSAEETTLYAVLRKEELRSTRDKLRFLNDRDAFNLIL